MSPVKGKVELNPRAIALLISAIIMALLWSRPILLMIYVSLVVGGLAARAFVLPRRAYAAERRLQRDGIKLLSQKDFKGLDALLEAQWLIRYFGRPFVLAQLRAMSAEAQGDRVGALRLFQRAAMEAPLHEADTMRRNVARLQGSGDAGDQPSGAEDTRAKSQSES